MKIGYRPQGDYYYLSGSGTAQDGKYAGADVRAGKETAARDNPKLDGLQLLILVVFPTLHAAGKHTPAAPRRRNGRFARKRKTRRTLRL